MHRLRLIILGALLTLLLPTLAAADIKDLTLGDIERLVEQPPEAGQYLLIDARPEIKYAEGFIPWAISLPKSELKERLAELPADQATRLVFYCGGIKCNLSAESAEIAAAAGYSDVATFSGGMPAWQNAGHTPWVSAQYIKMVINDPQRVALLVDARPPLKYNAGTIPGALNLPFQQFATLKGLLPADQDAQIIFFCGGYKCDLSHKSATAARALGYNNVVSFAGGWPIWKEASKRAFALVDPNNMNGTAPAAETVKIEGEIDAGRFLDLVRNPSGNVLLVDVRPADEYLRGHLPGAINILEDQVGRHTAQFQDFAQVVFYCNTGSKAAMAYYEAEALGLKEKACFLNKTVMIEADGSYTVK